MEVEHRAFVIVVECLYRFTSHPSASLAYALQEHGEPESLDFNIVVETEGISREVISYNETVFVIDDTVIVLVDILDITGFRFALCRMRA